MPNPKKPRNNCLVGGEEPDRAGYKYWTNACQQEYQYQNYINSWKEGKISGLNSIGLVSDTIKKYLRIKFDDKCCFCGWAKINPKTRKVPLVADHINGNWRNNIESNLRLLCPNCDSLTTTFAALNKGNGRQDRPISKRAKEGRLLTMRK